MQHNIMLPIAIKTAHHRLSTSDAKCTANYPPPLANKRGGDTATRSSVRTYCTSVRMYVCNNCSAAVQGLLS